MMELTAVQELTLTKIRTYTKNRSGYSSDRQGCADLEWLIILVSPFATEKEIIQLRVMANAAKKTLFMPSTDGKNSLIWDKFSFVLSILDRNLVKKEEERKPVMKLTAEQAKRVEEIRKKAASPTLTTYKTNEEGNQEFDWLCDLVANHPQSTKDDKATAGYSRARATHMPCDYGPQSSLWPCMKQMLAKIDAKEIAAVPTPTAPAPAVPVLVATPHLDAEAVKTIRARMVPGGYRGGVNSGYNVQVNDDVRSLCRTLLAHQNVLSSAEKEELHKQQHLLENGRIHYDPNYSATQLWTTRDLLFAMYDRLFPQSKEDKKAEVVKASPPIIIKVPNELIKPVAVAPPAKKHKVVCVPTESYTWVYIDGELLVPKETLTNSRIENYLDPVFALLNCEVEKRSYVKYATLQTISTALKEQSVPCKKLADLDAALITTQKDELQRKIADLKRQQENLTMQLLVLEKQSNPQI